jgi:TPR repeat protein
VRIFYLFSILLAGMLITLSPSFAASMFEEALNAYNNKNYSKAAELFLDEANRGNAQAQCNLGFMYNNGQGVPLDYKEALKWYRLAADQGDALAQNNLGVMYYEGKGVPQSFEEAAKWYRLAAEQGNAQAQGNLGLMYVMGQGMPEDFIEAYAWFAVSAANGNENSRDNMEVVIKNMTPSQIEKAQELAKEYFARTNK